MITNNVQKYEFMFVNSLLRAASDVYLVLARIYKQKNVNRLSPKCSLAPRLYLQGRL
jgi:hypothetical protein